MRDKIKHIIDDTSTKQGKIFDYLIQGLILLSLIAFSIETMPNNSPGLVKGIKVFEVFCIIVFSIEYTLRVYTADKPLKYIFSFYGIIDLLAILPFYLKTVLDLRALRIFRVFRIFRSLKLIRYNRALHRFHIAYGIVKEELVLFFIVAGILIFLSASGIYFFENGAQPETFKSVPHSLWWAVVTLTTVGYGDAFPITIEGKMFTFFVLLVGVGVVTVPAGLVATALSKAREIEEKERKENNE